MLTQTRNKAVDNDDLLTEIDVLVSPVSPDLAVEQAERRIRTLQRRYEHALIDLELDRALRVEVEIDSRGVALRVRDERAREKLLRFLERAAERHVWGSPW